MTTRAFASTGCAPSPFAIYNLGSGAWRRSGRISSVLSRTCGEEAALMDSGIDSDSVKVTTVVGVDRAAAFYIFMHEVDFWRKRGPRYRVDPSRGSCMTFEHARRRSVSRSLCPDESDFFEHGKVLAWEPDERIVFELRGRHLKLDERTEVRGTRRAGRARNPGHCPSRLGRLCRRPPHPPRPRGELLQQYDGLWWADLLTTIRAVVASRPSS